MQTRPYFHTPSRLEMLFQSFQAELGTDMLGTYLLSAKDNKLIYGILNPNQQEYPSFYTTLMKIANLISEKMQLGQVEENLIITDQFYILTRSLSQNDYYWGVMINKQTPLGSVRILIERYSPQILLAIV